jgi:hypothetical protein
MQRVGLLSANGAASDRLGEAGLAATVAQVDIGNGPASLRFPERRDIGNSHELRIGAIDQFRPQGDAFVVAVPA